MKDSFSPEYLKERFPKHDIDFKLNTKSKGSGFFGSIHNYKIISKKKSKEKGFFRKIFAKDNRIVKEKNFILKIFYSGIKFKDSLKIYDYLKKNKVPTFNTYRQFESDIIIMDDLSLNNKFCVSIMYTNKNNNNDDFVYLDKNKIDEILNFNEFVFEVIDIFEKFEKLKVSSKTVNETWVNDFLFFIGDKNIKTKIKVIVGDLDMIYYDKFFYICGDLKKEMILENINLFIKDYVNPKNINVYLNQANKIIEEFYFRDDNKLKKVS